MKQRFLVLIFLLAFSATARAARIEGRVLNAQGTAIAGAKVTVIEAGNGARWEATTEADGSFVVALLESGTYTVTVSAASGQEALRRDVAVPPGSDSVRVDLRLPQAPAQRPSVEQERNPNIFIYRIDLNDLRNLLTIARGPDPQYIGEFLAEQNHFGEEFGAPLLRFEVLRPRPLLRSWHGSLYGSHQNSALNARNFFNVGPLRPSRSSGYDLTASGPLLSDRVSLLMQFGQNFTSGLVNGNLQAPLASERTPRSTDPRINAIIAGLLTAYPAEFPNLPSVSLRQLNSNAPRDIDAINALGRIDAKLDQETTLAVRYSISDYAEEPFQLVAGQNPQTDLRNQNAYLSLTRSFSPQTMARLAFHFDRSNASLRPTRRFSALLAGLGIAAVPDIDFRGDEVTDIGPGRQFPRLRAQNRFQWYADVSREAGKHAVKAGWSITRVQVNDLQSDNSRGTLEFARDFGRSDLENFLAGTPSAFTITLGNLYRGFRNWEHAFFLQDRIRLAPAFTLSLGLRYELMTAPQEVNRVTDLGFRTDKNNLAPGISLAWNPGRGRTTVRASYGISYGTIFPVTYQTARFNPPATQIIVVDAPDILNPLAGIPRQPTEGGRSGLNLLSPDLEFPYTHQYSLGVERQVPWAGVVRIGYIGARSFHLLSQGVYNRARPVPGIPAVTATINQRRPDPRFFAVSIVESNSNAYYDALQLSWDKRLSNALSFRATYTFGKNIDTGGDFTNTASGVEKPPETGTPASELESRFADQKGPSLFDTPHAFQISYTYGLPFPVGANGLAPALLRGWQMSGVTVLQSGTTFHAHTGSDGPGFGNVDGHSQDRPNILNPGILGKSIDHPDTSISILRRDFFDTNIAPGGRGNIGMNTFRKDGTHNWNLSLSRLFHFPGGGDNSLQFRAEFFNLFNHPQFDKPGIFVASATFGKITNTVNRGRQIQFSLRLNF